MLSVAGFLASDKGKEALARSVSKIVYPDGTNQPGMELTGTGYAVRCAAVIAHENVPDAEWALEVLNRYGHLIKHSADR